ncbi:hypothetical protein [Pseudomonas cremoricolorata]|uniref:hypothetical protein n=1 Tax=Pseudomonas cremoricolorata TaxID=157783 RepID=UPI0004155A68|nr:hypothetical protein [Pseudomonas cremoricolorata]
MNTLDNPQFWLQTFRLELSSASSNLYGNARQQAEIRLIAHVHASQPALTPAQLASLTLVMERSDGLYEPLPFNGPGALNWWQTSERDTRFDLMPGPLAESPTNSAPPPPANKLMYVSTSQPGGSSVRLRARIQKDQNTVYYTDIANGFDSHVSLTTVRPPYFGENDYEWQQTIREGDINNVFLHEYSLRLKTLGLSTQSRMEVPGMIRWHTNTLTETYATYVGIALPGDKTVRYNTAIDVGDRFTPSPRAKTPGSDSMVVVLNGADNIPFNRPGLSHAGPCSISLVDRHGNDHQVLLRFEEGGSALERRSRITVSYPTTDESAI